MKLWLKGWENSLKEKDFIKSLILSFLFLFISFYINFVAGTYATEKISNSVTDIVLSNIRVFDVDGIFIYGSIFIVALITLALVYQNKALPFAIKSISLFVIIRSIFISLTHLGPFPTAVAMHTGNFLNKFTFGGDLFFSGHTGLPFLMALIFWKNYPSKAGRH